jgi:hypothetical protein
MDDREELEAKTEKLCHRGLGQVSEETEAMLVVSKSRFPIGIQVAQADSCAT